MIQGKSVTTLDQEHILPRAMPVPAQTLESTILSLWGQGRGHRAAECRADDHGQY